jgi:hypothetical protein
MAYLPQTSFLPFIGCQLGKILNKINLLGCNITILKVIDSKAIYISFIKYVLAFSVLINFAPNDVIYFMSCNFVHNRHHLT